MKKKLNQAYYNGIREGIEQYAYWKDGVQYVGTCGTTLKDALARIDKEEKRAEELLKDRIILPELEQGQTKYKIIEGEMDQETIDQIKAKKQQAV